MKFYTFYLRLVVTFSIVVLILFYLYNIKVLSRNKIKDESNSVYEVPKTTTYINPVEIIQFKRSDIVIAVVACGDRLREALNMLKSTLMFSKEKLNFLVFSDDNLLESFTEKLAEWKSFTNNAFTYKVMPLWFPVKDPEEWKNLFKPCAAQRLFFPNILKDVDSVLYVDTDTLFLTPVETVWSFFHKMNASQMTALAPEDEDPNLSWYNRFAMHPYYGKLGVNSGVMLMNLTRMRAFQWSQYVVPIYKKYKLKISWGDQDIINIIFHYHPGKLLIYSCRYNFRPDHCMYMSVCKSAEKEGVAVVHGSRGFFHSEKQPAFQAIYKAFDEFRLGGDIYREFYQVMEGHLEQADNTNCGHVKDVFLKNIRHFIDMDYNAK